MNKIKNTLLILVIAAVIGCGGHSDSPIQQPPPPVTITGHWAGAATSNLSGLSSGLMADFVQGAPAPDGTTPFAGTITISNSCIQLLSVNGKIQAQSFALFGSINDGSTIALTATINPSDTHISGNWATTSGLVCVANNGTFFLDKQ